MRDNDFNLINSLFSRIVDKEKEHGSDSLTAEEQVVLSIWHASGIIGNGGFQYFFEQELDAEAVACAYERIGCNKCAELLRLALSLFPDALRQGSWNERIQFVERNSEMFSKLRSAFWKADKGMQKRLAEYVRGHADKLCSSVKL